MQVENIVLDAVEKPMRKIAMKPPTSWPRRMLKSDGGGSGSFLLSVRCTVCNS